MDRMWRTSSRLGWVLQQALNLRLVGDALPMHPGTCTHARLHGLGTSKDCGWQGSVCVCISEAAPARRLASPALSLCVFAATSPTVVTDSSPTSITAATATDITLAGTVWSGDLVTWAVDCSAVAPDQDPTDGSSQVTAFTVTGVNTYKLCYRASGLSDSVEQSGVSLTVLATASSTHCGKCS